MKIGFDEIFQYALRSRKRACDRTTSLANHRKAIFGGNKRPYRIMIEEATQSKVSTIIELDDEQKVQWVAVRGSDNLNIPRHCNGTQTKIKKQ